ncbi:MAG: RNA polymerase sigma factor [Bacteroidales bacterium]|nr:RNA polymerase sigma factor [Bacteroidales bacterium]
MGQKNTDIHKDLIISASKGNQQSMYRLYKLYVQAMYNTCIRMVSNQFDAEDIIQESFISAFNNLKKFRGDSSFGSWLKRIVINKSISFLRSQKLEFTEIDTMQIESSNSEESNFPEIDPAKVHETIKTLPEKARVVLNLYLLEGFRHKEIADILKISESTSKSQYLRAKKILRDKLIKEIQYEI